MSLQGNHQFIINWWLSSQERIHWVLIRNTWNFFVCSKYVYKTQILDVVVKQRSRKNSKQNSRDYNEKLTLETFTWNLPLSSRYLQPVYLLKLMLLTRDQRLSEQYHRENVKTSEIHWGTSANQNFSRGDSNYQYTAGRLKIQTFFTGDWLCMPHFHRETFRGGFSRGTEAGCLWNFRNISKYKNIAFSR